MKFFQKIIGILPMFLLFSTLTLSAQDFSGAVKGLQSGSATELAKHFDGNVEVTILKTASSYSKTQAEMVIKNFFSSNVPRGYKAIHNGDSGGGAKYQIGELTTSTKTYRTYLFGKMKGSTFLIQEIRIEDK